MKKYIGFVIYPAVTIMILGSIICAYYIGYNTRGRLEWSGWKINVTKNTLNWRIRRANIPEHMIVFGVIEGKIRYLDTKNTKAVEIK